MMGTYTKSTRVILTHLNVGNDKGFSPVAIPPDDLSFLGARPASAAEYAPNALRGPVALREKAQVDRGHRAEATVFSCYVHLPNRHHQMQNQHKSSTFLTLTPGGGAERVGRASSRAVTKSAPTLYQHSESPSPNEKPTQN